MFLHCFPFFMTYNRICNKRKCYLYLITYTGVHHKMLIVARRVSLEEEEMLTCLEYICFHGFYTPVSRRAVLCDWVWWEAGGLPDRFPHTNFSSVYRIFTKLGHLIPMWKGKNPFILGPFGLRSKSPLL